MMEPIKKNRIEEILELIRDKAKSGDNSIDYDDYINAFRMATRTFDEDLIKIRRQYKKKLEESIKSQSGVIPVDGLNKDIADLVKKHQIAARYKDYLKKIVRDGRPIRKRLFFRRSKAIEIDVNLESERVGIMLDYSANKTEVIRYIGENWAYIEALLERVTKNPNPKFEKRKPYQGRLVDQLQIFKSKEYNVRTQKISEILDGKYADLEIEKQYSKMRKDANRLGMKIRETRRGNRKS